MKKAPYVILKFYSALLVRSRKQDIVDQRRFLVVILRSYEYTLKQIAAQVGLKDHATIIYHLRKHGDLIADPTYLAAFNEFKEYFERRLRAA